MKLAFYYHTPVSKLSDGRYSMPGCIGLFIDSLANEVEQLIIIAHTDNSVSDYILKSSNIHLLDLGLSSPAWHRHIYHKNILRCVSKELEKIDAIIVRSPSPLSPFFHKYIPVNCKLFYYIVGSYENGAKEMKPKTFREWLIQKYLLLNHFLFLKQLNDKNTIVNSPSLKKDLGGILKNVHVIPSTTLTNQDFYQRDDTCNGSELNVLYTGRIDLQKGLMEILIVISQLSKKDKRIKLNIVGWEDSEVKTVEKILLAKAIELRIQDKVVFHGKKKVGNELNIFYRQSDIYVIPTYHEGFPRTIWEAMANSLPVIASNVGGIPYYLENGVNAILIEPKNIDMLRKSMELVIQDKILRKNLIKRGYDLVQNNTLEKRANEMIRYISDYI